ncbi:LysE family translocator [Domibacillus sp. DTU_2020_1001157_1_SI_ALB_TIR_016]|uniref:LysE family translocator n=1 Tax=Domibacillus sp. DTU_2020_1001157_1_SI_ALB_TIR_016 TaxID=3077789 RepID=UPI0028F088A6|nr:LysE family translocator [Domibacillus sp. DTU_2020_1001157_1_SI_ALB_TIR_016]WNS77957.1 LysE family translocator [Domibacillus sp. DTU_2020_1001157_1_SI_ALB_TIR_016]
MLAFIVMTLFVVMSPGVDTALITKRTMTGGRKAGFQMAAGITAGSLGHTIAAALGLSALLVQSAIAFNLIKWVGAVYLIYLGVTAFLPKKKEPAQENQGPTKQRSAFREGLLSNLLNPKVAVFFLTFLPQFVTSSDRAMIDLFLMGCTYALLSIVWFVVYVFCLHFIRAWLLSPAVQSWTEKATGIILVGFGIKLLFTKADAG